jgi:hypothetical protein
MNAPASILVAFTLFSVSLGACQSTTMFGDDRAEERGIVMAEPARILVNGKDRGTTPQTVRISRGRHELDVVLRQGRRNVRAFKVEETYSPNAAEIDFSFLGREENGTLRLTVEELPTKDDFTYVIPFYQNPLTIEDNQYGLTLLVAD